MQRITPSEYITRRQRAVRAMERVGIDCLVILAGPSLTYFTGLKFMRERYRITAVLIDRAGHTVLMGPRFEEAKMRSSPARPEVSTWTDDDDQHLMMAQWIADRCGSRPRIGLEATTDFHHYVALARLLCDAGFVDAEAAIEQVRAIKSTAEVACLRAAAVRTQARMERVKTLFVEGMTEIELAGLFGPGAMVQFGLTTASPNAPAGYRRLAARDVVVIDAGDWVEGYRSDLTRTFFVGEPSSKMREVYRIVNEAELAAIDAIRPGEPARAVDLAAREVIEQAGYGDFVLHRASHGLGLAFHEIPISDATNADTLAPGMVLTVEPGIYLPGKFGVRLENDILVTGSGCELLADRS